MRAKMTAALCEASFVAGAVLTPPILRKTKEQADKMARQGARGYVKLRRRTKRVGEATGRPGQYTAMTTAFVAQTVKVAADRWWRLVDEAEREMAREKADRFGLYSPPEPVTTIEDLVGLTG